jgi:SUMO ligase MMS21 Smc5/6 complex component
MSQTIKENINKLVRLFMEQQSLDSQGKEIKEQIKEIKKEIKATGHNPARVADVAKAMADNKISELEEKAETTVELITVIRS